ncbi:MAG: adenylate/guanylate cyclase domain-containing protein, partial [Proteobacteria bacterium]|nr:adenylate/guanylate cyclase domain-containing protein [Pseudomonadota bacterium]
FLALPAIISACSKLADAVMERVHPLARGFEEVGAGNLDISVEVAGSKEFADLARGFNTMVGDLALSSRMERAFGQYLSTKLLDRIRAQHGDAHLPASLRDSTVFFADIRGFTSMSENKEPQEVLDILNRYFDKVIPIVHDHDGYLDKFIGDEFFVVFNGPVDQADHAERGARCAIAVQEQVALLNKEGFFDDIGGLQIGIGLATGPLVAGNLGSKEQMEYTVIGDTVNLASRLTSKASAGQIITNAANVAAQDLSSIPLEPIKVKGREEQVIPHRLWPL